MITHGVWMGQKKLTRYEIDFFSKMVGYALWMVNIMIHHNDMSISTSFNGISIRHAQRELRAPLDFPPGVRETGDFRTFLDLRFALLWPGRCAFFGSFLSFHSCNLDRRLQDGCCLELCWWTYFKSRQASAKVFYSSFLLKHQNSTARQYLGSWDTKTMSHQCAETQAATATKNKNEQDKHSNLKITIIITITIIVIIVTGIVNNKKGQKNKNDSWLPCSAMVMLCLSSFRHTVLATLWTNKCYLDLLVWTTFYASVKLIPLSVCVCVCSSSFSFLTCLLSLKLD